jgi:hypothetical protein
MSYTLRCCLELRVNKADYGSAPVMLVQHWQNDGWLRFDGGKRVL